MVNKVILIGNVGVDPEIRTLESGVKVARVRLATTERSRNRETGDTTEHTEWHTITLWRGLADVVDKYVRSPSHPSRLIQRPCLSFLSNTANSCWLSHLHMVM